jgi:hypothetical protein
MASKDLVTQFAGQLGAVVMKFRRAFESRDTNWLEVVARLAGEAGDALVEQMADVATWRMNLQLLAEITVVTGSFTRDSFFGKTGPAKLCIHDSFRNWVLVAIPETVTEFQRTLQKRRLAKPMSDWDILSELGNPEPFTSKEFAAVLSSLVRRQPNGEFGNLLTNGYNANLFYVQLEGRVVLVSVRRDDVRRDWRLRADSLGGDLWHGGHCVFSCSPDA